MNKEQQEAFEYLQAKGLIIRDGEIEGEPAYRFSDAFADIYLKVYDKLSETDHTPKIHIGAIIFALLLETNDYFSMDQIVVCANVMKNFAETLIIQRDGALRK